MSMGPPYALLGEVSIQVLCHFLVGYFVFLVLSCVGSLCILESKPLSKALANMFSHRIGSPFILLMFSLAVKKLFNLMYPHLFILSFISLAVGDILANILLHGISEIFMPMFSARTFMVSQLIFKSFIHLEFIFVYGAQVSFFFFFACSCLDLPTPFIEEVIFTPFYASSSFVKY